MCVVGGGGEPDYSVAYHLGSCLYCSGGSDSLG